MNQTGQNYAPWRVPCTSGSNVPRVGWLGQFYSNSRLPPTSQSVETYVTQVPTYSGSGTIPAYSRPGAQIESGCGTTPCSNTPNFPPCEPWLGPNQTNGSQQYTLVSGQANTIPAPTYSASVIDVSTICRKAGTKTVAAQRYWHGAFPWTSHDNNNCPDTYCVSASVLESSYLSYQSTPSTVKYLTIGTSATLNYSSQWFNGASETIAASAGGAVTVDADSGVLTSNVSTTETDTLQMAYDNGSGYDYGPSLTIYSMANGVGTLYNYPPSGSVTPTIRTTYLSGGSTNVDSACSANVYCNGVTVPKKIYTPLLSDNAITVDAIPNDFNSAFPLPYVFGKTGTMLATPTSPYSYSSTGNIITFDTGTGETIQTYTISVAWSYSDTVYSWNIQVSNEAGPAGTTGPGGTVVVTVASYVGSLTLSSPNYASSVVDDMYGLMANWPLNDDNLYPWRTDASPQMCPLVSRNEFQNNVSPIIGFNPYYVPDLRSPITDVAGNAPYSTCDSGSYPGSCFYNADNNDCNGVVSGSVSPPWGGCCPWQPTYTNLPWIDPNCHEWLYANGTDSSCWAAAALVTVFDGSILGAPLPYNYQNYFDFNFINYQECNGGTSDVFYPYQYGLTVGQINSTYGLDLPLNATQIINNYNCIGIPPSAYIGYNDPSIILGVDTTAPGGGLLAVKWAEIKESWPSINFYLPAGSGNPQQAGAMFSLDESTVCCVSNLVGSGAGAVFTSIDDNGNPYFIPDTSGVWGGSSVNGFFDITAVGSVVTLGTQHWNCPSNFTLPSQDEGQAFGRLRFITSSVSLLGPQTFAFVPPFSGSNRTGSWSTPQPTFGMQFPSGSEYIDMLDKDYNVVATNIGPVIRIDDSTFYAPTASIPAAKFIQIHGSPAYYTNDTLSKGDYIYADWLNDFRTNAENNRLAGQTDCSGSQIGTSSYNNGFASCDINQGCVPQTPCCPSILCWTPNGETWSHNSNVYPFPSSFVLDEKYGSRWQGWFMTVEDDPFFQGPHTPCGKGGTPWDADNTGTCQMDDDTKNYYGIPMQVEPRLTPPPGFPTPPVNLEWISPVPVSNTGSNVLYPPQYVGYNSGGSPAQAFLPFVLRTNLCNSIATGCGYNYDLLFPPC